MTALPFELARKLKDAGWPQPGKWASREDCEFDGIFVNEEPFTTHRDDNSAYSPSLSELIAACPLGWEYAPGVWCPFCLLFDDASWKAGYLHKGGYDQLWLPKCCRSATPEEAVANLWLALKEQSVPLPATG